MVLPLAPAETARILSSAHETLGESLVSKLSAPLIISEALPIAPKTLLVFGQETAGWGGDKGALSDWIFSEPNVAAKGLAELYGPPGRASPFWSAQDRIASQLGSEWRIAWSNIMRVDTSPLAIREKLNSCSSWWNLSYEEVDKVCDWQAELQKAELAILRPDAVLFMTGPYYDYCIRKTFGSADVRPVAGVTEREVLQISVPNMPSATYRIYHPNFLQRRHRWPLLDLVLDKIIAALLPR